MLYAIIGPRASTLCEKEITATMHTINIKKCESDNPQTNFSFSDDLLSPLGIKIAIKKARDIAPIEPLTSK